MYVCVKLPPEYLNFGLYSLHLISTYIYRVIIATKLSSSF